MEAMMTEAEQKMQEKELKKHFHFQWGQLAACVAVFCVCGALAGTVYLQHSGGKGTADTTAMMTAESADVAEESAELEVAEDAMEDAADHLSGRDPGYAGGTGKCKHSGELPGTG